MPVLQTAHWQAADLSSRICAYGRTGDHSPVNEENAELGWTQSARTSEQPWIRDIGVCAEVVYHPQLRALLHRTSPARLPPSIISTTPYRWTIRMGSVQPGLLQLPHQTMTSANVPGPGPEPSFQVNETAFRSKTRVPSQSEKTSFGLLSGSRSLADLVDLANLSIPNESRWTRLPPFRFSVEF